MNVSKKKIVISLIPILGGSIILAFLIATVLVSQRKLTPQEVLAQVGCTCTIRSSDTGADVTATCAADEILITGGCSGEVNSTHPVENGWRCIWRTPGYNVQAHAWCCK